MSDLPRRQAEALRYQKAVAKERVDLQFGPAQDWAKSIAVEMLLTVQCMKYEYHTPANVVIRYFCTENGLDFDKLEQMAMRMVSDDPYKPQPE